MKRWILAVALLAVGVTAMAGYLALRRDEQYRTFIEAGDGATAIEDTFGAIEAFSGAIALRPGSMLAWLKRGDVYLQRGDHRSALRDLRQAVALDPSAPRPLELLGDTYVALGRETRAVEQYEAYLRLDDRDARVLYKLAFARLYDGRPDAAIVSLTRALHIDDRMPEAHYLLGICLEQTRRTRESIRALERAVALAPARIEIREALAERYRAAGRSADEVRQLEAITALDPGRHGHHLAVADAWARSGRTDLAVTTLVRAIQRFDDDSDLLLGLGRVWLGVAETRHDRAALGKAVEALRRAAALSPSGPAFTLLGRAQLIAGDPAGAFRSLQQGTAALPVDPRALGDLATAAERLGRYGVVRDALIMESALVGEQGPARVRADRAARIARACERLGDRAGVVTWLERAVAATPEDRALSARLARVKQVLPAQGG